MHVPWRSIAIGGFTVVLLFGVLQADQVASASTTVHCPTDDLAAAIAAGHAGATLTISGTCTGSFVVTKKLTLIGMPGATLDGGGTGRTLFVDTGVKLKVTKLTIQGGNASPGAGVWNQGTLTISNSTLSGNSSTDGFAGEGGAITNNGTLTVSNSTLSGNTSTNLGGAIENIDGAITITNSTLSGNSAANRGGAIFNDSADPITITQSTLSGNSSGWGGAVWSTGAVTITSSTLSGNSALASDGGAIFARDITSTVTIRRSTLSGNSAVGFGGGVASEDFAVNVGASIVAGNTAGAGPDCHGDVTSNGYDLIGDADGCSFASAVGDQVGSSTGSGVIDALLGPLAANGGPTDTRALSSISPAMDRIPVGALGVDAKAQCPSSGTKDQRGMKRPKGGACDVGAYELKRP